MKRNKVFIGAALGVLAMVPVMVHASADTHSACSGHTAVAPYVSDISNGVSTLHGAGQIGGCPAPIGTESVSITVALQSFDVDTQMWIDKATANYSKSWNRYYRLARQAGGGVDATCVVGDWRTDVKGGDGFQPTEWTSPVVTFVAGDSGVCGSYGGGDG